MTSPRTPNLVLRAWRETRGLTRPQMADALNGTPAAQHDQLTCTAKLIAKWETGEIRRPRAAYRVALHQLTGHDPTALGFTAPTPRRRQPPPNQATPTTGPASTPSHPPTEADLHGIDDLAALAVLLSRHGYSTQLASLPTLILHHPGLEHPRHITANGPDFAWGGTAICQRPPAMPLVLAAQAIDVLPDLAAEGLMDPPQ
jgi:transcriptional regulator with XRE-family HTH domain